MTTANTSPVHENGASAATWKHRLLVWTVLRLGAALAALPLVPFLFRHHFVVLVLLRPSQAILLAGGFLAREDRVSLLAVLAAAIPLQVLAVWLYYALGRAWSAEIDNDEELPFLTARLLHARQVRRLRETLRERGPVFVFLVRFALFPAGLVAASVGASGLRAGRYIATDVAAAVLATSVTVFAGYGLGIAHEQAGPWVVVTGVVGLATLSAALTVLLRRDHQGRGAPPPRNTSCQSGARVPDLPRP